MATAARTVLHDSLNVRLKFDGDDNQRATVHWGRSAGTTVKLEPDHPARAMALSAVVMNAENLMKKSGGQYDNLGKISEAMEKAGKTARTFEDWIAALEKTFGVTSEGPKPKRAGTAPDQTSVTVGKKGRGIEVNAIFPTGETFSIKVNGASLGLAFDPDLSSRSSAIGKSLFGVKTSGVMTDEELANHIAATARDASTMDGWFEAFKETLKPQAPRR